MPIERYLVHRVSCNRGISVSTIDGRFGFSMKDEKTMVFDDPEEVEAFARALLHVASKQKGER